MRFLVIGTNFISDLFADAVSRLRALGADCAVTAVLSRREETGRAFLEKNALRGKIALDPEGAYGLFRDGAFDGVYVASPNICHEAQSVYFLERGVPVLCEKPAALSPESLGRIGAAAKRGGAVFMEAMRPTHDPALYRIKRTLGGIGPIRSAHLEFSQYSSRYGRYLSGERVNTFDPAMGNSALGDLGVYALAVAVALFGGEIDVAGASALRLSNGFEASGAAILSPCGGDGFVCTASWSKVCRQAAPSVILGEGGSVTVDRLSEPREAFLGRPDGSREVIDLAAAPNNMIYEIADFMSFAGDSAAPGALAGGEARQSAESHFAASEALARLVSKIRLAQGER